MSVALNREAGPIPTDALDYFDAKGVQPGFDHRDVWAEEHHRAFTAAKFMRMDVLEAVQGSLRDALGQGQTYEQWRRAIGPQLEQMGFWGKQVVVDPRTGELADVDVPSRLRRIFDTNMRTARAAGQWARIQRTKESHPFLIYLLGPSERHRPEHLAWHGLMLPVDDPFWRVAFPPNGFGCRCHVRQVSQREATRLERDGIRAGIRTPILDADGNPTGRHRREKVPVRTESPPIALTPWENKRTGETILVPIGVQPGFDRPPSLLGSFGGGEDPDTPEPDRLATLRQAVFEGDEDVPPQMSQQEIGHLLSESMAANDGGTKARRLLRAVARMHAGEMLREGTTGGPLADRLVFRRLSKGVLGVHNGASGQISLTPRFRRLLVAAAAKLRAGGRLTKDEREALHVAMHETVHSFGFRHDDLERAQALKYDHRSGTGVEEVITEAHTRRIMRDVFRSTAGLPDLVTGKDPLRYYSKVIHRTMTAILANAAGVTPDETPAERQIRIERLIESAAQRMRQMDSVVLEPTPPPPPGRNGFIWAFVNAIPFSGGEDDVATARTKLYTLIADREFYRDLIQ